MNKLFAPMETDNSKKLKMQTLLSVLTIVTGILLAIGKMYADSEPGAIPLLLIISGTGWYFVTRSQIKSEDKPR